MSRAIRGHQIGGPAAAAKLPGAIAAMAEKTAAAAGTQGSSKRVRRRRKTKRVRRQRKTPADTVVDVATVDGVGASAGASAGPAARTRRFLSALSLA